MPEFDYGWRVVFLLAAGFGAVALVPQAVALTRLPCRGDADIGTLVEELRPPRSDTASPASS